jgi:hypothetical protein
MQGPDRLTHWRATARPLWIFGAVAIYGRHAGGGSSGYGLRKTMSEPKGHGSCLGPLVGRGFFGLNEQSVRRL